MSRFWLLITLLLMSIIVPFMIWGEHFDQMLTLQGARELLLGAGSWAWALGIALLIADMALPIPSTVVMSALGVVYGWIIGGCIASLGSVLAGLVAYTVCRALGQKAARWIAGPEAMQRAETMFAKHGGWLVALSRSMPVLPEAIACLAGLARMPLRQFLVALVCGSLPVGFAFAAIGDLGTTSPGYAVALSALLPIVLWSGARWWLRDQTKVP